MKTKVASADVANVVFGFLCGMGEHRQKPSMVHSRPW